VKVGKVTFYYYIIYLDAIIPLVDEMGKSVVKKGKVKRSRKKLLQVCHAMAKA